MKRVNWGNRTCGISVVIYLETKNYWAVNIVDDEEKKDNQEQKSKIFYSLGFY